MVNYKNKKNFCFFKFHYYEYLQKGIFIVRFVIVRKKYNSI